MSAEAFVTRKSLGQWAFAHWPWALIAVGWIVLVAGHVGGSISLLSHHYLIEHAGLPWILALLVFLLSWQAMTVAMMLPGSLPLFKLFRQANAANRGGRVATLLFLAGYATVWTGFAALAFAGDTLIHRLVDEWAWLAGHPWIIAGVTLVIAGGYQLTPLKEMCLTQCRNPLSFFVRHYRRGRQGAWRLGMEHGRFCLGCCWALMLVMFGLGVGNLAAMLVLATVMLLERTYLRGRQLVPAVGAALLAYGVLVLLHPAWLAPILAGGLE